MNPARFLSKSLTSETNVKHLFYIVAQYNYGLNAIKVPAERLEVCRLNVLASQKARENTAYESSEKYILCSLELLPQDPWKNCYELCRDVTIESIRSFHSCQQYDDVYSYADNLIDNAKGILDAVVAYEMKLATLAQQGRYEEMRTLLVESLVLLGIPMPKKFLRWRVKASFVKTYKKVVENRSLVDSNKMPEMIDPNAQAAEKLLFLCSSYLYFLDPIILIGMCL